MTNAATVEAAAKSPLVAAQKIVEELKGMGPEQQSLALKFASETLGIQPSVQNVMTAPVTAHPHPQTTAVVGTSHSADIKSFTTAKAPQSDQQFTAVVAYFYQFEAKSSERKDEIDAATMKEAARLAGRPQVANWGQTLANAKNAGYLNPAGVGKFTLSPVGENLVAITLPGKVWGGKANSGSSGKKPAKTKATTKKTAKKSG